MRWQGARMTTPPDPFALSFDSIEIDPSRAPSPAAIENALAAVAPPEAMLTATAAAPEYAQPGYFLLDDAGGRFVVDREMGVVMLSDETLLASEHGAVHAARLRVVEASGTSYDLELKLRLTGRVPQMLGGEEFSFGGEQTGAALTFAPPAPRVEWTKFAPALGAQTTQWLSIHGPFGALFSTALPATNERISIAFAETLPAPAAVYANWSV
jgi:hypothetical protein